ncbi:UROD/MetE-like protein [Hymenopellis radicata]|nr:UROD/MetE-like protein [Hymenopellis radicata]
MTARNLHVNPPFRAEHVGSLLRPKYLFQKRGLYEEGKCSLDELRSAEDMAVQHVVKLQQDLGFKTITDGEMRRGMFFEGVFNNLEGMVFMPARPIDEFKDYIPHIAMMKDAGVPSEKTIYCSGKIKRTKPFYVDQFKYTASLVPPDDVKYIKLNVCSPSWFHQRHGSDYTYDHNVYKNDDEYFDDLGVAYREEFQELYDLGCRHIQIDDPTFCFFCSDSVRCRMMEMSVDPESLLDTYIRAINVCTKGRPDDLTVSVHMCRGNFMGAHFCDGGYDPIASKVFNSLDVDTFYLEYDDERSGDFAALKELPPNKSAVLGLVTTKRGQLEPPEALKARINEAAHALLQGNHERTISEALNQLSISTQCGFASVWQGNPLTEQDQYNKLKLLADTAKQVWTD